MNLQEFLAQNPVDNVRAEVPISARLQDKEGNLFKFTIKAMTDAEFEELRKRSMTVKKGGKFELDLKQFNSLIVVNNTVEPNFKNAEDIKALGCTTPEQYVSKVLLAGEIQELSRQIQRLSGFDTDMEELKDQVKN